MKLGSILFPLACSVLTALVAASAPPPRPPVKVGMLGGVERSGLWPALADQFAKDTGWHCDVTAAGPKSVLREALERGQVDLIAMHDDEDAAEWVRSGLLKSPVPWAQNELHLIGPTSDPAGVRGMKTGATALRQIADTRSLYLEFTGPGSRQVARRLWEAAGIDPQGDWVLSDDSPDARSALKVAAEKQAYLIAGRFPVGEVDLGGLDLEVMLQGDPAMRRTYVVMLADERRFPDSNQQGAQVLHTWMSGQPGQKFLRETGDPASVENPRLYPVTTAPKEPPQIPAGKPRKPKVRIKM